MQAPVPTRWGRCRPCLALLLLLLSSAGAHRLVFLGIILGLVTFVVMSKLLCSTWRTNTGKRRSRATEAAAADTCDGATRQAQRSPYSDARRAPSQPANRAPASVAKLSKTAPKIPPWLGNSRCLAVLHREATAARLRCVGMTRGFSG